MIKDRHFKLNDSQKTSSQESFTIDYAREAPYIKPLKLQQNPPRLRPPGRPAPLQSLFINDTVPRRLQSPLDRTHLSYLLTPQKYDFSNRPPLYSPTNPTSSPRFTTAEMFERRIRQMTRDWGAERVAMRNEIKRLEFIVQQWEMLDQRKNYNNNRSLGSERRGDGDATAVVEVTRLKKRLAEVELEKNEMFRDFMELERELKKVRVGSFEQSGISDFRMGESSSHSANSFQYEKEIDQLRGEYEKVVLQKDTRYQQLLSDFNQLQGQLQNQRRGTVILLQKRTAQLQNNLTTIKNSNEQINSELRSALERSNQELLQEKQRAKLLQTQISMREQNMKLIQEELSEANQNIDQLRDTYMNKCLEIEISKAEGMRREERRLGKDVGLQTVAEAKREEKRVTKEMGLQIQASKEEKKLVSVGFQTNVVHTDEVCLQACPEICQTWIQVVTQDPTIKRNSIILGQMKEDNEKLLRKIRQLELSNVEKDNKLTLLTTTLTVSNNNYITTIQNLQTNLSTLSQQNTKLRSVLQSKSQKSQEHRTSLVRSDSSKSIQSQRDKQQLNELRLSRHLSKHSLQSLREQLSQSRRKIELYRNEQQYEKIQASSQDRLTRNNYEVTIHNLNSELNNAKIKFEGVQARLEIKVKELKEKDEFIRNTIVSRVGKGATEPELEFFLRRIEEWMQMYRQKQMAS